MAKVDLTNLNEHQRVRFLWPNGKAVQIEDIVCSIDEATGHYVGLLVEDEEVQWKDGKAVLVRRSLGGPVIVDFIGEDNEQCVHEHRLTR